jgi:multidrug efflux pump subunit AcrB
VKNSRSQGASQPGPETRNFARLCIENPHLTWVLLIGTVIWGIYGYTHMPQRKDPDIPVKAALVVTPWPGASAEKVEELVTKTVEKVIASNNKISKIESISRSNSSVITVYISDNLKDISTVLDDIGRRLAAIRNLPEGAGPIQYQRDFGDTATLMLTVASPKASAAEVEVRAAKVREAIESTRARATGNHSQERASLVFCFPAREDFRLTRLGAIEFVDYVRRIDAALDPLLLDGAGCVGADVSASRTDGQILALLGGFLREHFPQSQWEPDVWQPFVVRNLDEVRSKLASVAGEKYSYRELDEFTDVMEKALLATGRKDVNAPLVAKVDRSGILPEKVYLLYSQERLASYGIKTGTLSDILKARNLTSGAGEFDAGGKNVLIAASGEFRSEREIGDISLGVTKKGTPLYLRDIADVVRSYDHPARFLNFYSWRDSKGHWQRTRSVTLSVQMGAGQQISNFARQVDVTLEDLQKRLPKDLIVARTSDQPRQVEENIELFMTSLYEAVGLVVLVSLIGFWEWRSALLMAISIPLTLLMTFGMMQVIGIDLQQVSVATLIIALGLLVDDPVVAGDAIKRELGVGTPRGVAAWLGPTKLATAICYATITNIVAYLPFLMLTGSMGQFLYSLPVVMTISLVASRIVSMTFIPLLGAYILRGRGERSMEERRTQGFAAHYYRVGQWAIRHRWAVLAAATLLLVAGGSIGSSLRKQFMPKDLSQLAFIDVFLPEDSSFAATSHTVTQVETIVEEVSAAKKIPVEALSSFVGGGAPRFWYSLSPEAPHTNYAQIVLLFQDKRQTHQLLPYIQSRVSKEVASARIDVRQLENGDSVGLPVAIRISGEDNATLRVTSERVQNVLRDIPLVTRVRDNWGEDRFNVELNVNADRANLAGLTNLDIAGSSSAAVTGTSLTTLREGDKQIPVVARLRSEEIAGLDDVRNLYVYSRTGKQKIPLRQVASLDYNFRSEVIRRRNQSRTITVSAAPQHGILASEVMAVARPALTSIAASLPPGYKLEVGGEEEKQKDGFADLSVVLAISVVAIFLALTFQFKNAVKPFIVFAAVPFGAIGALAALWIMGTPFGFMGFLGVISLVGVIVSHIIVLFDFIEEKHAEGEPFEQAVLDAGIMRLRPVMITVGATVFGLFPLAAHGGPLWEPLCYAQIGGLTAATFITLLLVPVFYAICVLDLKIVKWESRGDGDRGQLPKMTAKLRCALEKRHPVSVLACERTNPQVS